MPTAEQTLADSVMAAAAENTKPPEPAVETVEKEERDPPGDFRANILRFFDLADAAVRETHKTRHDNAYLRARHEQERAAHARTMELLRAAELVNTELRAQLATAREANIRLQAHMEGMGNSILNAARGKIIAETPATS